MRILGLDPGLGTTGWGLIEADGNRLRHIANGQIKTDTAAALPRRLANLADRLEALSDNRNRTATNVRTAFSKNGGNLGASGSVSHGFERLGLIEYPASAGDDEKVLEAAIEAGADDVESDEDGHRIWTSIDSLHQVARSLERLLGEGEGAKLAWKPSTEVEVRGNDAQQLLKLMDALEEDDDVQTVWGNYDVPDEELERLA